jgi:DNA-binding NarL/FixJ family response regulator
MPATGRGCDAGPVALRCVIVDDNPEFLTAARDLLSRDRVEVVGLASSAAEALRIVVDFRPDVALVDVYLGGDSGFDLARRLADGSDGFCPAVIFISTYAEQDLAEVIAASPAAGFLPKSDLSRSAIDRVLSAGRER